MEFQLIPQAFGLMFENASSPEQINADDLPGKIVFQDPVGNQVIVIMNEETWREFQVAVDDPVGWTKAQVAKHQTAAQAEAARSKIVVPTIARSNNTTAP